MELTIKISDYLTEDEIKNMVEQTVASEIRQEVSRLINKQDFGRILSNCAWFMVFDEVDKTLVESAKKTIIRQVLEIISDIKSYNIFRRKTNYDEASVGQKIIEESVLENRKLINEKVVETISLLDPESLNDDLNNIIYKVVEDRIMGKKDSND